MISAILNSLYCLKSMLCIATRPAHNNWHLLFLKVVIFFPPDFFLMLPIHFPCLIELFVLRSVFKFCQGEIFLHVILSDSSSLSLSTCVNVFVSRISK